MRCFFETRGGWAALVLRLGLGTVFFPHGMGKLFGWFGGSGFSGTLAQMTRGHHPLPTALVVMVIAAEGLGSLGLITGFLTRLCAFGLGCTMVGAVAMVHWHNGMFMNWSGKQAGEGFEFHLLAITICLALLILGGGKWSLDGVIAKCCRKELRDGQQQTKA